MTPEEKARRAVWDKRYYERHPEKYQELIERSKKRHKLLYATDPEYRERQRATAREYGRQNREKINARRRTPEAKARARELRLLAIERRWNIELKCKYGITTEEYKIILARQGNVCAICKHPEKMVAKRWGNVVPRRLSVDHCHVSGKVRGLLCTSCNRGLGAFKDSVKSLKTAIKYLS